MAYPSSLDSFTARTDNVDEVVANDVNGLQTAIVAVETELGTDPAGTATDLKTRLAKALAGAGDLQFAPATTLTISSGTISPTQNWHLVDTEDGVASDTLSTITAPSTDGYVLFLRPVATARNVILEHDNGGNIYCTPGIDITLSTAYDLAILIYDSTLAYWIAFHPTVAGTTDPQPVGSTDWYGTSAKYSAEDHRHKLPIGTGLAWDTDNQLTATATSGTTDHGALGGLADDDHTIYSLANGTRAFTGAITISSANAQDGYVWKAQDSDGLGAWEAESGGGTTDHGALGGLLDDDHTIYSLASGARAFTGAITITAGTPVAGYVWTAQDTDGLGAWAAATGGSTEAGGGTTDHTALSNIGTNTHAAIDTALALYGSKLANGWISDTGTTYAVSSSDDPTFVMTVLGKDVTTYLGVGMRLKLTQTTVKYFIITAVAYDSTDSTITVYGGQNYNLTGISTDTDYVAVSEVFYSPARAPLGFPASSTDWTEILIDTTQRTQSTPTAAVWYNPGNISLTIPIGVWHVFYTVFAEYNRASATTLDFSVSLSTSSTDATDAEFTVRSYQASNTLFMLMMSKQKQITLAAKTTYYLIIKTDVVTVATIEFRNDAATMIITAQCAYV